MKNHGCDTRMIFSKNYPPNPLFLSRYWRKSVRNLWSSKNTRKFKQPVLEKGERRKTTNCTQSFEYFVCNCLNFALLYSSFHQNFNNFFHEISSWYVARMRQTFADFFIDLFIDLLLSPLLSVLHKPF